MAMAIQNSIFIPLSLSFDFNEAVFDKVYYLVLDYLIDVVFIIDIAFMFFTSIINEDGMEIFDSKKIAETYLGSFGFVFDFLSVGGSNFISKVFERLGLLKLFKIIRVRRVGVYISKLTLPKDVKAFINMVKLAFYMVLWLHMSACIWYYMITWYYGNEVVAGFDDPRGKVWYAPINWDNQNESVIFLESTPEIFKY